MAFRKLVGSYKDYDLSTHVIEDGYLAVDVDTGSLRIGDGVTAGGTVVSGGGGGSREWTVVCMLRSHLEPLVVGTPGRPVLVERVHHTSWAVWCGPPPLLCCPRRGHRRWRRCGRRWRLLTWC